MRYLVLGRNQLLRSDVLSYVLQKDCIGIVTVWVRQCVRDMSFNPAPSDVNTVLEGRTYP